MSPTLPISDVHILDRIIAVLKKGTTFCLSGHQNPDGDVIGSELALASFIQRLGPGKRVDILNHGPVPRSVAFLPGANRIQNVTTVDASYDVVVVHECSGADRMGNIIDLKTQATTVINLDHHLHNPNFGTVNLVEPTTSSTAELVFKIIERSGVPLLRDEAICLYTGLVTDTGWFRYGNTTPQSHRIASALLAADVPVAALSERIYLSKSPAALQLLASTLSHMRLYNDDRVALITIPEETFRALGATPDDTEDIVNFGLQIESVVASILLKEKSSPPTVKVSLRSKGDYDINQVARVFGGGGHRNASGCSLPVPLAEAERLLVNEIGRIFS